MMDQISTDPFDDLAADDAARHRNDSRDSLFLMAEFRLRGTEAAQSVRVRNLSTGGLMAELASGLPQGQEIDLNVRGIGWIAGKVAWSAAGRVGISFDETIDPMLARKPVGTGAGKTPAHFKPAVGKF